MAVTRRGRSFPAVGLPIGGGQILPGPASFYVTGEDRIRIVTRNNRPACRLKLQARLANLEGDTVAESWDHVPNEDVTTRTDDFELGTGQLLNVTVFTGSATGSLGLTYAIVQLVRGVGPAAIVMATLLGGYVTEVQGLGFPGSPIRSSLDGPGRLVNSGSIFHGVGAELSLQQPAGVRWEVVSLRTKLSTSAAAGNRRPRLRFDTGPGSPNTSISAPDQVGPSNALTVMWAQGFGWQAALFGETYAPLPQNVQLSNTQTLYTSTIGFDVNDQYGDIGFTIREWLEVF